MVEVGYKLLLQLCRNDSMQISKLMNFSSEENIALNQQIHKKGLANMQKVGKK